MWNKFIKSFAKKLKRRKRKLILNLLFEEGGKHLQLIKMSTFGFNKRITDVLEKLKGVRLAQGEVHRSKAYESAIQALKMFPKEIVSSSEVKSIPGIGKKMLENIDEILKTGTVPELAGIQMVLSGNPVLAREVETKEQVLKLFKSLDRVGEKTAEKWYQKGYRKLSDIPEAETTFAQRIAINLHADLIQKVPRDEIDEFKRKLEETTKPLGIQFEIAGSYRRGKLESGDIDVLLLAKEGIDVMSEVLRNPIFTNTLAHGPKKFMGVGKIRKVHRRIDLELVQPHEWAFAMTYFTGPASFNVKMRDHASKNNLRLNEKGLYNLAGDSYPAATEQDLFKMLGLQYLSPSERDKF